MAGRYFWGSVLGTSKPWTPRKCRQSGAVGRAFVLKSIELNILQRDLLEITSRHRFRSGEREKEREREREQRERERDNREREN